MASAAVLRDASEDIFAGVKIIDADTHLTEPFDLWTSRATPSFRNRVPQARKVDGRWMWFVNGDVPLPFGDTAASVIAPNLEKLYGLDFMSRALPDVHPSSSDTPERVQMMDELGIWAQIVYPNIMGFAGHNLDRLDPDVRIVSTQIYNDAAAEMQRDSGGRIFPMMIVPWWDIGLAVAEVQRGAAMGLRGVNINADPQDHVGLDGEPLPDLGSPFWQPLWELCEALALPVNFHIGASRKSVDWVGDHYWPSHSPESRLVIGSVLQFPSNARVVTNLLMSGVLDRHPRLQFVSVESGIGWIPFLLEGIDYQYLEAYPKHGPLQRMPSEYFKTNLHACFWFESRDLEYSIRQVGIENVMFETDFPHPTCLYPDPLGRAAVSLQPFTPGERRKIMSGNAARLYNIPLDG